MVTNLINEKGNAIKNQFIITEEKATAFQSYNSRVCEIVKPCGMGFDVLVRFDCNWDYSNTTVKHLYEFLRQNGLGMLANKQAIEEAIERGYARHDEAIAVVYAENIR